MGKDFKVALILLSFKYALVALFFPGYRTGKYMPSERMSWMYWLHWPAGNHLLFLFYCDGFVFNCMLPTFIMSWADYSVNQGELQIARPKGSCPTPQIVLSMLTDDQPHLLLSSLDFDKDLSPTTSTWPVNHRSPQNTLNLASEKLPGSETMERYLIFKVNRKLDCRRIGWRKTV